MVIGAFISIGFSYAFPKSITVFFKEIEVIFNASSSKVSWISSIMLAVMYAGGKWAGGSGTCAPASQHKVLLSCWGAGDSRLAVVTSSTKISQKLEILSLGESKTSLNEFS